MPTRNVLVVEDNPQCQRSLAKLLRHRGHSVECAGDGQEAIGLLERFNPDVIILDLMMPVMDGVIFLEVVRHYPQWQNIRVIVYTGSDNGPRVERLAELGVSAILLKASVDAEHLLKLVALG